MAPTCEDRVGVPELAFPSWRSPRPPPIVRNVRQPDVEHVTDASHRQVSSLGSDRLIAIRLPRPSGTTCSVTGHASP